MSNLHQVFSVHVTHDRDGSALLWRYCAMLCTSGFVNGVVFADRPNACQELDAKRAHTQTQQKQHG